MRREVQRQPLATGGAAGQAVVPPIFASIRFHLAKHETTLSQVRPLLGNGLTATGCCDGVWVGDCGWI